MSAAQQIVHLLGGSVNDWRPRYGKDQLPSERQDKPKAIWFRRTPPPRLHRYFLNLFLLGNGVPVALVQLYWKQKFGANYKWGDDVVWVKKKIDSGEYKRWWDVKKQGWSDEPVYNPNKYSLGTVPRKPKVDPYQKWLNQQEVYRNSIAFGFPHEKAVEIMQSHRTAFMEKESLRLHQKYLATQYVYRNAIGFGFSHEQALLIYQNYLKSKPKGRFGLHGTR